MNNEKRKPTFTLCVNDAPPSGRPHWRNIGAAWETEKGNLFLKIDDGQELRGTAMLFPYREKPANGGGYRKPYGGGGYRPGPRTPYTPPASPPAEDYMDRQRRERRNPTQPPTVEQDTVDLNVEPPDDAPWL